jgi:hypothetical protein
MRRSLVRAALTAFLIPLVSTFALAQTPDPTHYTSVLRCRERAVRSDVSLNAPDVCDEPGAADEVHADDECP